MGLQSGTQLSVYTHTRVSILFQIPSPLRLLQGIEQGSLDCTVGLCRLSVLNTTGTHDFFKYTDHLLEELNISENMCFTPSSEHPALRKIEGCFSFHGKQSDPEGGGSVWPKKTAGLFGLLVGSHLSRPEKAGAGCLHGESQILKFWFCPCVIHVNKRLTESHFICGMGVVIPASQGG